MAFPLIEKNDDDPENLLIYDILSTKFTKNNFDEMSVNRVACQAVVINNNNTNNQQQQKRQKELIAFGGVGTDVVESCHVNKDTNLYLNQQQQEQHPPWKQSRRRMPIALSYFAAVNFHNDNNYVYLYGGWNKKKGGAQNGCYKYDVINDTCTIMPSMKTKRSNLAKAALKSKLFAIGGSSTGHIRDALDTLESLDVSKISNNNEGEWKTFKVKMNKKRDGCRSEIINGILYVIGGVDENGNSLDTIEMYDLSKTNDDNNKFTLLNAKMKSKRYGATSVALGYYIIIIGGYDGKDSLDTVEIFNTKTKKIVDNSANLIPSLTEGHFLSSSVLLRDSECNHRCNEKMINTMVATHSKICVIGGFGGSNGDFSPLRTTETIDIRTHVMPMSKLRFVKNNSNNEHEGILPTDINLKILSYL